MRTITTITTLGQWHLGCITTACLLKAGFNVCAADPDTALIQALQQGTPPVNEPGLNEALQVGHTNGRLSYVSNLQQAAQASALVWVTFDTPVDEADCADTHWVLSRIEQLLPHMQSGGVLLVSSQLPVQAISTLQQHMQQHYPAVHLAVSPENLRLGQAMASFEQAERMVIGVDSPQAKALLEPILSQLCPVLIWMSVASAAMVKHAINTFLATSITLTNEIAALCELSGASAREVELGLRSEPRIGPKAYVKAGGAFSGGTLARDVQFLCQLGQQHQQPLPVIEHVLDSNQAHRQWPLKVLKRLWNASSLSGDFSGKNIALLGLAYKPHSNVTRRSAALEWQTAFTQQGAQVLACDPLVNQVSPEQVLTNAHAVVLANHCPEFLELSSKAWHTLNPDAVILDPEGFLTPVMDRFPVSARYYRVGGL